MALPGHNELFISQGNNKLLPQPGSYGHHRCPSEWQPGGCHSLVQKKL